jgi:hypothetical protein
MFPSPQNKRQSIARTIRIIQEGSNDMRNQTPFLDITSFIAEEISQELLETPATPTSPFLALYESHETGRLIDPEAEEYAILLNELYDEEFHEGLSGLVDEATVIYETQFQTELDNPQTIGYQAERLLTQHFAPLAAEAEMMFEAMAREFSQRDPHSLPENEIDAIVDRYQPAAELAPSFEDFFGKLKKVAKKAISMAKKGAKLVAKVHPVGLILGKLKSLIKPLLKRVIQTAIGKLPLPLQPMAKKLADRLPFLKEFEESYDYELEAAEQCEACRIQHEFNHQIANLLLARSEVEQDLEVARIWTEQPAHDAYPIAELDQARERFVENLMSLRDGGDPTPYVENFVPAILPALRVGIKLVGRKKVVNFLAKLLGKLIIKFVGPQYTPALSQAIVDAGLRLIQLEASAEDAPRASAEVVAATVEETVRRVAALPDYVLDNEELLEGFALEAFEQAAAANLPPVLSEETYRKRPSLGEARKLRGTWKMMPGGRRKRYKKFSRVIPVKITPHKAPTLEAYEAISLEEFLEEELGVAAGEEVEGFVHLYEAMPGTHLQGIARLEENTPGLNVPDGYKLLHPLTPAAAEFLLGEPELGRQADPVSTLAAHVPAVGQRFYYLEIAGKKPLLMPGMAGRTKTRRPTQFWLIFDFPKNEIRIRLFLSEIRAQEIAVKLRQHAHIGSVVARLDNIARRGLHRAFAGGFGRIKIIHEAVTPDQWFSALRRLPSLVPQTLMGRLQEWMLKALTTHLKQHSEEFIKAAEDTADGVTLVITLSNPPGFPQLRQALKGNGNSLGGLSFSDGAPVAKVKVIPGYSHE